MSATLFDASVPVCLRYIASLDRILDRALALPPAAQATLLAARLAPDMLPFAQQVQTAVHLSLRACFPLSGRPVPPYLDAQASLPALRALIADRVSMLKTLDPQEFAGRHAAFVTEQAGLASLELPATTFLFEFALPNYLFHVSMAYAIARYHGVPLGKADFDGFHRYAR